MGPAPDPDFLITLVLTPSPVMVTVYISETVQFDQQFYVSKH